MDMSGFLEDKKTEVWNISGFKTDRKPVAIAGIAASGAAPITLLYCRNSDARTAQLADQKRNPSFT